MAWGIFFTIKGKSILQHPSAGIDGINNNMTKPLAISMATGQLWYGNISYLGTSLRGCFFPGFSLMVSNWQWRQCLDIYFQTRVTRGEALLIAGSMAAYPSLPLSSHLVSASFWSRQPRWVEMLCMDFVRLDMKIRKIKSSHLEADAWHDTVCLPD